MPGIVVGVDQSAHAHEALDWAMREAAARQVALAVITVVPAQVSPFTGHPLSVPDADNAVQHARQAAEEAVAKSVSQLDGDKPPAVTVQAFAGFPAQALIDASHGADLLVVGARGQGGFAALLLGSVSTQVGLHADCPVVIVPSGRRGA